MLNFLKKLFSVENKREDIIRLGKIIQQSNESVDRDVEYINNKLTVEDYEFIRCILYDGHLNSAPTYISIEGVETFMLNDFAYYQVCNRLDITREEANRIFMTFPLYKHNF